MCAHVHRRLIIACIPMLVLSGPWPVAAAPEGTEPAAGRARYIVPVILTARSGRVHVQAGTVFPPGSLVVTAATAIRNAERVLVVDATGTRINAVPVVYDSVEDLVVLRLAGGRLPAADLSNVGTVARGERVVTIGYPLGTLRDMLDPMPASGRALLAQGGPAQSFIIQAVVNTGYSGSPVLNSRGQLAGILRAWVPSAQDEPWVIGLDVAIRLVASAAQVVPPPLSTPPQARQPAQPRTTSRVIKLLLQVPLTGPPAFLGQAMREGAELAMLERAGTIKAMGFTPQLLVMDDQNRPEAAMQHATAAVNDPDVLVAIGHFATGVALAAAPAYVRGDLPFLAPASSVAGLTDAGHANIFRLIGRDDLQGAAAMRYLSRAARPGSVYVLYERDGHGLRTAAHFAWEARRLRFTVHGMRAVIAGEDMPALVSEVLAARPDVLFFGGSYRAAALFLNEVRRRDPRIVFVGDDGLDSSEFLLLAGDAAAGVIYTTPAAPARFYPQGASFATRFAARFGHLPGPYAAQAYDAVAVALDAIQRSIAVSGGARPDRLAVLDAVRRTRHAGITGMIEFDTRGDRRAPSYFVFRVSASSPGQWLDNTYLGAVSP